MSNTDEHDDQEEGEIVIKNESSPSTIRGGGYFGRGGMRGGGRGRGFGRGYPPWGGRGRGFVPGGAPIAGGAGRLRSPPQTNNTGPQSTSITSATNSNAGTENKVRRRSQSPLAPNQRNLSTATGPNEQRGYVKPSSSTGEASSVARRPVLRSPPPPGTAASSEVERKSDDRGRPQPQATSGSSPRSPNAALQRRALPPTQQRQPVQPPTSNRMRSPPHPVTRPQQPSTFQPAPRTRSPPPPHAVQSFGRGGFFRGRGGFGRGRGMPFANRPAVRSPERPRQAAPQQSDRIEEEQKHVADERTKRDAEGDDWRSEVKRGRFENDAPAETSTHTRERPSIPPSSEVPHSDVSKQQSRVERDEVRRSDYQANRLSDTERESGAPPRGRFIDRPGAPTVEDRREERSSRFHGNDWRNNNNNDMPGPRGRYNDDGPSNSERPFESSSADRFRESNDRFNPPRQQQVGRFPPPSAERDFNRQMERPYDRFGGSGNREERFSDRQRDYVEADREERGRYPPDRRNKDGPMTSEREEGEVLRRRFEPPPPDRSNGNRGDVLDNSTDRSEREFVDKAAGDRTDNRGPVDRADRTDMRGGVSSSGERYTGRPSSDYREGPARRNVDGSTDTYRPPFSERRGPPPPPPTTSTTTTNRRFEEGRPSGDDRSQISLSDDSSRRFQRGPPPPPPSSRYDSEIGPPPRPPPYSNRARSRPPRERSPERSDMEGRGPRDGATRGATVESAPSGRSRSFPPPSRGAGADRFGGSGPSSSYVPPSRQGGDFRGRPPPPYSSDDRFRQDNYPNDRRRFEDGPSSRQLPPTSISGGGESSYRRDDIEDRHRRAPSPPRRGEYGGHPQPPPPYGSRKARSRSPHLPQARTNSAPRPARSPSGLSGPPSGGFHLNQRFRSRDQHERDLHAPHGGSFRSSSVSGPTSATKQALRQKSETKSAHVGSTPVVLPETPFGSNEIAMAVAPLDVDELDRLNSRMIADCELDKMATAEKIRQEIEGMKFAQFVNGLDSVKAEMQRAWAVFEMRQADEQLVSIQSSRNRITTLF